MTDNDIIVLLQRSQKRIDQLEDELSKTNILQSEGDELMLRLDDVCEQLNTAQNELDKKEKGNLILNEKLFNQEHVMQEMNKELDLMHIQEGPIVQRIMIVSDLFTIMADEGKDKDEELLLLKNDVDGLVSEFNEAAGTVQERDDEILRLGSTVTEIKEAIVALKNEYASKDVECNRLRDNIDKLNGEYAVKSLQETVKIELLESDVSKVNEQIATYSKDMAAKDQLIFDMQQTIDDVNLEIAAISSTDNECVVAFDRLTLELKDSRSQASYLEESLSTKDIILKELREKSDTEAEWLRTELEESKAIMKSLNVDLAAKNQNIVESHTMADSLSLELEILKTTDKSEVAELQDLLHESKIKLKSFDNIVASKDAESDDMRRDYEKLKLLLESRDDKCENVGLSCAQIERLELNLDDVTKQNTKYAKDLDEQEHLLRELKTKLHICEDNVTSKESDLDDLRCDSDKLKLALETKSDEFKHVLELLSNSESKVSSLEEELEIFASQAVEERNESDQTIAVLEQEQNATEIIVRSLHDTIQHLENELFRTTTMLENHNNTADSYAALEAANEQRDAASRDSIVLSKEIEMELTVKISELQDKCTELRQQLRDRDAEIDEVCRESKLMELEFMKADDIAPPLEKQFLNEESSSFALDEQINSVKSTGVQADLGSLDESEAKEAVRELLMELNLAVTEKDKAIEDLFITQHELQALRDICNQKELETCALETSLRKASSMVENVNNDANCEVHQVIAELVQEIARIKDRSEKCSSCSDHETRLTKLLKELAIANETVESVTKETKVAEESLLFARTKIEETESVIISAKGLLADIIEKRHINLVDNVEGGTIQQQHSLSELVQLIKMLLDESNDILEQKTHIPDNSSERLLKDGDVNSTHSANTQKPFAVAIDDMINQSTEVIQNALSEFKTECSMEGDDDIYSSAQMVEFGVYESLRRKYDALQEEREELLNETFALMDASAAANAAELDAITRRVENKADLRLIECRQEADARIQFYDDRLASCTCSS